MQKVLSLSIEETIADRTLHSEGSWAFPPCEDATTPGNANDAEQTRKKNIYELGSRHTSLHSRGDKIASQTAQLRAQSCSYTQDCSTPSARTAEAVSPTFIASPDVFVPYH